MASHTTHASMYRFYVAAFTPPAVGLPEDQSHHALHVLRLETGAQVLLFDGKGRWATGTLRPEKRGTFVDLTSDVHQDPPPALHVTLATAMPKADRAEWLIEQASQLGVAAVQWLDTDRGVVKPKEGGKIDKHRRIAMESAKQCGRTHIMGILPMRSLSDVLNESTNSQWLWLEPHEGVPIGTAAISTTGRVAALIGPEGGWSEREIAQLIAHKNLTRVKLTPTILRIETACAAVAALLLAR